MKRAVLITTEHRGVFFGYADDTDGDTIKLSNARNVLYWPAANAGFMGLAANGPKEGARVGPEADIEVRKVTSVTEVTEEAANRFHEFVWTP